MLLPVSPYVFCSEVFGLALTAAPARFRHCLPSAMVPRSSSKIVARCHIIPHAQPFQTFPTNTAHQSSSSPLLWNAPSVLLPSFETHTRIHRLRTD